MLPITRVALFKHGIAYYQREGTVTDNETIQLSFKSKEMNDVLKSLTTLDFDNGSFAALSYDSEEPVERKLAELNIHIPKQGAITSFLDQLKGIHVSLATAKGDIEGSIIGIEELYVGTDPQGKQSKQAFLALLTADSKILHLRLLDIVDIQFVDQQVQKELVSLMDTLASSVHKDQKRLSIQAIGEGKREISVSYVVEAPVWKTSYRMIFLDDGTTLIQGWAMVDNTSDEDWHNVQLTLVAGLPISFIHDLYSPRYQQRPEIKVNTEAAVAPPEIEVGMAQEAFMDEELDDLSMDDPFGAPLAAAAAAPAPLAKARRKTVKEAVKSSTQVQTRTQDVGDLFSYEIQQAISVQRGQSALVPILQSEFSASKVLYYNKKNRDKNPMSSVMIKNDSGLTLEGGPLTVFDNGQYLGEAMLDTLRKEDEKITPYSVELGVTVNQHRYAESHDYTKVSMGGHYIHQHKRTDHITEYTFQAKTKKDEVLYLDHPFQYSPAYETDAEKPKELVEITDNFWRFKIELKAGVTQTYKVVEAQYTYDSIHIPYITGVQVQTMAQRKLLSKANAEALERIASLVQEKEQLRTAQSRKREVLEGLNSGQDRLRQNIGALGSSMQEQSLRERYISKLSEEEDRLEQLLSEIESLGKQIDDLEENIAKRVEDFELQ